MNFLCTPYQYIDRRYNLHSDNVLSGNEAAKLDGIIADREFELLIKEVVKVPTRHSSNSALALAS
ncbi:MAG: hypothetical protein HQL06_13930 [Nitrospirae bacterium]|nr:hypothetical protein [Nitrospirota bacterium]